MRKLRWSFFLCVVVPLIAILIVAMGRAARAQVDAAALPMGRSHALSRAREIATRVQTRQTAPAGNQGNALIFIPSVTYDSGGYTGTSVAIGDFNRDGKLDIVAGDQCAATGCSPDGATLGVLLGNGDGTFQPAVNYGTGGLSGPFWPVAIAIADVNGDHKLDLVAANGGSNTVGVLLGNDDGTFQPAVTYGSAGSYPVSVAVADVNGDGKLDIAIANVCADANCDGSVSLLLGNGDGTFQPAVTYSSGGNEALAVAIVDVNSDGKPDLLVATNYLVCGANRCWYTGAIGVLLGHGDGTFQQVVIYDSGGSLPDSLAVADLNGDGKPDVVAANSWSESAGVLMGNGDGTFQPAAVYGVVPGMSGSIVSSNVTIADVNNDGHADLIVASSSAGNSFYDGGVVSVLLGNADGTFQPAVTYPSGGYEAIGVAVGDVNGDSRPDLLVASACITDDSFNCAGPINRVRGALGVLLNNYGAPSTTTSLASSVNPAAVKWAVSYTATVMPQGGGTAQGTVTFTDGFLPLANLPLVNNQAVYSTSYAQKGTHTIVASYWGELGQAAGSKSGPLDEVIKVPHPTATVVMTSRSSTHVGQRITFTAIVTSTYGPIPDGERVTFYDGTTAMDSVWLVNGKAAYTTSSLAAKTHNIRAHYIGDADFTPSTGSVQQLVLKYSTEAGLTSAPNPSNYGQAVTFTATVTPSGPYPVSGNVRFWDGTTALGSVALNGGVATLTKRWLAVGTHSITAHYLGDSYNATTTSHIFYQVVQ